MKITLFKKLNATLISFLILMISANAFASEESLKGSLTGQVFLENKTLPGAIVRIAHTSLVVETNASGKFEFIDLEAGNYELNISYTGLKTIKKAVNLQAAEHVQLRIDMGALNTNLGEITVHGRRNRYKSDEISNSLRLNQELKKIPQNIQVVSADAMADQQVISMSDGVLRNVSGATKLEHWGDLYTRINMRGTRISSFRNGVNVQNSNWGPLTEDMSFVDHVEFVKGPAGFMMAAGDPSGLYNVVTKKPSGRNFNGSAGFTFGSFDLYRGTLDLDGQLTKNGNVLYRLNLMGQNKGSFRPNEFNNRFSIAPVLQFKLDDKSTLTLEYALQKVKMSNVGSYYLFAPDGFKETDPAATGLPAGIDPTNITDHSIFVNFQHHLNDRWKLTAQTAYLHYNQIGSSFWPTSVQPDGGTIRNISIWDAQSNLKSGQLFINGEEKTGSINHKFLMGIDVRQNEYFADWSQSFDLDTAGSYNMIKDGPSAGVLPLQNFNREKSVVQRASEDGSVYGDRSTSIYLQDELGFFNDQLRLTLAGRYSVVSQSSYFKSQSAAKFTPRVGLSYSVSASTAVYALYDQAFLPQSGITRDGSKVRPITGNNMEVGVKKDWLDKRWNSTLSIYRIIKNNELASDPINQPGEAYSIVLGKKLAQGVELDIKGEVAPGWNVIANYAYTDARVLEVSPGITTITANDRIPGFAKHQINLWSSYRILDGGLRGLGISLGASYQHDRDTWSWAVAGKEKLPNYLRVDGGLFYEKNKVKISANVFNLLNDYLYSGAYYGYGSYYYWQAEAPRNLRVSLSYQF